MGLIQVPIPPPSPELTTHPQRVEQLPQDLQGRRHTDEMVGVVVQVVGFCHYQVEEVYDHATAYHLGNC